MLAVAYGRWAKVCVTPRSALPFAPCQLLAISHRGSRAVLQGIGCVLPFGRLQQMLSIAISSSMVCVTVCCLLVLPFAACCPIASFLRGRSAPVCDDEVVCQNVNCQLSHAPLGSRCVPPFPGAPSQGVASRPRKPLNSCPLSIDSNRAVRT